MHVEAVHWLWTTSPVVAHQFFSIQPTVDSDEGFQILSYLGTLKTARIRNRANFCVDSTPRTSDTVEEKTLQNIKPLAPTFLSLPADAVGIFVQLLAFHIEHGTLSPGRLAYPRTTAFWSFRNDILDVASHAATLILTFKDGIETHASGGFGPGRGCGRGPR